MEKESRSRIEFSLNRLPGAALALGAMLALTVALAGCGSPTDRDAEALMFGGRGPGQKPRPGQEVLGEYNFAILINNYAEGHPNNKPWAAYWWAFGNGQDQYGIASGKYGEGAYKQMSPAGKYDAVRGLEGAASAQDWEARFHGPDQLPGHPPVEGWWGHCNGWSGAAALYPEPRSSVKVNGIEFTVADIKALLAEAAMVMKSDFYGSKLDYIDAGDNRYGGPAHMDVVPDQFFLVLTNSMGIQKKVIVIDEDTGTAVWNQPVIGYRTDYPKPSDYKGYVAGKGHVIELTTRVWWARDNVAPDHVSEMIDYGKAANRSYTSRDYKYELWVDAPIEWAGDRIIKSGNVVVQSLPDGIHGERFFNGGQYLGFRDAEYEAEFRPMSIQACWRNCWPDFMWVPYAPVDVSEYADYGIQPEDINPNVDLNWIRQYLLTPGDKFDPRGPAQPVVKKAPDPKPKPSPLPMPPRP